MPIQLEKLNSVAVEERHKLPQISGIYIVAIAGEVVDYVGLSKDIQGRWRGASHHRFQEVVNKGRRIYWYPCPVSQLRETERHFIAELSPRLNATPVKINGHWLEDSFVQWLLEVYPGASINTALYALLTELTQIRLVNQLPA